MSETQKHYLKIIKFFILKTEEGKIDKIRERITHLIKQKSGELNNLPQSLLNSEEVQFNIRIKKKDGFYILKIFVELGHDVELNVFPGEDLSYFDLLDNIQEVLPSKPYTSFTIIIAPSKNQGNTDSMIRDYADKLSLSAESINRLRDITVSSFDKIEGDLTNQYYLVSPHTNTDYNKAESLRIIKQIAFHTAELIEVENQSSNIFSVLEVGEIEIGERVEGYLWKLMGPENIKLDTLESWLSYIMERDSTLSAMIGSMEINLSKARMILFNIEGQIMRLNKLGYDNPPQNPDLMMQKYRRKIINFEDYIIRGKALKSRLVTVLDEVRTYLSLQQQKLGMEEQKSSKEQLVRLVNLQEIFHKVEIFIVAVYITEMAHIVFEVLSHEHASFLTALSIPFALLIAIIVSRLLHKE